MCERSKRQPVAPWSRTDVSVCTDLKDVVGGRLEALDHDERLRGVRRPVGDRVAAQVVHNLIRLDPPVLVLLRWRVPLQLDARRADADGGEVLRSTCRNWKRQDRSNC